MYVCMYVRMYVCTYVRMYVCTYVCMYIYRLYDLDSAWSDKTEISNSTEGRCSHFTNVGPSEA